MGYWKYHKYTRRSVEADVEEFVGWPTLADLMTKVPEYNFSRNQALFATTFLTGGRIEEVLQLNKENFTLNLAQDEIIVKNMRLLKRYDKTGSWTEWTDQKPNNKLGRLYKFDEEKKQYFRNRFNTELKTEKRHEFRFAASENFANILATWLPKATGLLFPGQTHTRPLSYSMAYHIITATGYYPHWLRAQRASCLISEYGWKMEMMMEWMGWEELTTARHYAKYGASKLVAGKTIEKKE